jgi:hypothetical protein
MAGRLRLFSSKPLLGSLALLGLTLLGVVYYLNLSPVREGRSVSFGLVGKFDLDGDGRDDREAVKALIVENGGEVSLDLGPDGELQGEFNDQTRWLILGDGPTGAAKDELLEQAKSRGVRRISFNKFLAYLEYRGD